MKFGLSGRVLPVLEVDDIHNVGPWAFIAIDALCLTVAGASVDGWQAVYVNFLKQAFWGTLTSDEDLGCGALTPLGQDVVVVKVFEEHGSVDNRDGVNELWESFS